MKENNHKIMQYYEKAKPYLVTLLYLAIFIALYLIYGSGDTHNNFIYNEF
ncbi:D-alanyl-lipoteichoic acid biosynthesis protein [Staphylococcus aureus]|nr:D-alanyl-lipoteichoic acid biosynthesis protein [Staphylococcus aureus]